MGRKTLKERREVTLPTRLSEMIKNEADYEANIDIINAFNDIMVRKHSHRNIYKDYNKNLLDPITSILLDSIKMGYTQSISINSILFEDDKDHYKEYLSILLNTLLMEFDNSVLLLDKSISDIETPSKYITIDDFWSDDKIDTIIEIRNKNRLQSKIFNNTVKAPIIYCFSYKELIEDCDSEKEVMRLKKSINDRIIYLSLKDIILIPLQASTPLVTKIKPLTITDISELENNGNSYSLIFHSTTVTKIYYIGPMRSSTILKNRFGSILSSYGNIYQLEEN